jgi:ABC-type nitrate/sulfonate/bicarbonate transport system substrate-binding protein
MGLGRRGYRVARGLRCAGTGGILTRRLLALMVQGESAVRILVRLWSGSGRLDLPRRLPSDRLEGKSPVHGTWRRVALVTVVGLMLACGGAPTAKPSAAGAGGAATTGPAATSPAAPSAQAGASQAATASAPPVSVAFAYTGPSAAFTPVWVAQEEGYFREQGLDVSQTSVQPAPGAQALIAGDFQFESTGPQVIDARLGGADLVYVADLVPYFVFDVYAQPDVRDAAALKGGSIGVTQAGATTDFAAQAYARRVGLTIGQDLQVNYVGGMPGLLAALQNKLITSAILSAPTTLTARKSGFTRLVALADLKIPFEHAALVASRAWLQGHEDVTRRFLRAYVRGIATTRDNSSAAINAIRKYTEVEDPEELQEAYEAFKDVFPPRPTVSRDAVRAVIEYDQDPRAKSLDVESLISDSLVP